MSTFVAIPEIASLLDTLRHVIEEARGRAAQAVNQEMVALYWELGRYIVEFGRPVRSGPPTGKGYSRPSPNAFLSSLVADTQSEISVTSDNFIYCSRIGNQCLPN